MPRLDITPLTGATADLNRSAPKLNAALDDLEAKRTALVAAINAYNAAITFADSAIAEVTANVGAVDEAANGLLGQGITLPSPVELPPELPAELVRSRNVKLTK